MSEQSAAGAPARIQPDELNKQCQGRIGKVNTASSSGGLSQEAPEERLVDQLGSSTRSRLPGSVGRFGWFASSLLAVMTEHKINCAAGRHNFFSGDSREQVNFLCPKFHNQPPLLVSRCWSVVGFGWLAQVWMLYVNKGAWMRAAP